MPIAYVSIAAYDCVLAPFSRYRNKYSIYLQQAEHSYPENNLNWRLETNELVTSPPVKLGMLATQRVWAGIMCGGGG